MNENRSWKYIQLDKNKTNIVDHWIFNYMVLIQYCIFNIGLALVSRKKSTIGKLYHSGYNR